MVNDLLLRLMARLQTAEEGQGMVEYALILALVSVVAIVILMGLVIGGGVAALTGSIRFAALIVGLYASGAVFGKLFSRGRKAF